MPKEIKRDEKWALIKAPSIPGCFYTFLIFYEGIFIGSFFIAIGGWKWSIFPILYLLSGVFIYQKSKQIAKEKLGFNSTFILPKTTFQSIEAGLLVILLVQPLPTLFLIIGILEKQVFIFPGLFFSILPAYMGIQVLKEVVENKSLINKFGESRIISDTYIFQKGEVIGLFFQNKKLINYTNEITVTLRNIEEKISPVRDEKDPTKILKQHKFYCHFEQSRDYALEVDKIGLVFDLPRTNCLATNYTPENPIYWEITIENEACDFHHRFIIDVLAIPDDNKGGL